MVASANSCGIRRKGADTQNPRYFNIIEKTVNRKIGALLIYAHMG